MTSGITFFDVETPNRTNSKICSIGIIRTDDDGRVEYEQHFFVNPEQGFDSSNIDIHGVTPSQVRGQPTFAQLWESELSAVFSDSLLVAHNASFDINVLGKTLNSYGIQTPEYYHLCTMSASKRLLPHLGSSSLPVVSQHYGVALPQHHDALYDAKACEGIYWGLVNEFGPDAMYPRLFIYTDLLNPTYCASNRSQLMTDLYGITLGVSLDGTVRPDEHNALRQWAKDCSSCCDDPILRKASLLIHEILADGHVDDSERERLLNLTRPFVTDGHNTPETVCLQQLIGILKGVSADGRINRLEAQNLLAWIEEFDQSDSNPDFELVGSELRAALQEEIIDSSRESRLLSLFKRIINPVEACSTDVVFAGKKFVLSGNFTYGLKSDVEAIIKSRGGEIANNVSGKVAYVVVGNEGSSEYAHGNYGTKVKKAMELQDKGKPIRIIAESDLCL